MIFSRDDDGPSPHRPLMGFIILTLVVGASGTPFTEAAMSGWYDQLVKPGVNPPSWLFAPVWTTLYILMAIAAWRVWKRTGIKSPEMVAWFVQLALNALWTPLFFGAHLLLPALIEMCLMWLAIAATLVLFWRKDTIAGLLMLPYLAWVSFAFALNFEIWRLNG